MFKEIFALFTLCLGTLLSLILIGRMLQLRELFLSLNLSAIDMLFFFVYLSPLFLTLILPISCMLGIFLTFLRMSSDRELVALKAGGVSLMQLLAAPILFCVLCVGMNLAVSLYGTAWGMENFRQSITEIAGTKARLSIQAGIFNQTIPNVTIFSRNIDREKNELHHVFIEDKSHKESTVLISAPQGSIETDEHRGEIFFRLHDGTIYRQEQENVSIIDFTEYLVRFKLSDLVQGVEFDELRPKELSWNQLNNPQDKAFFKKFAHKIAVEKQKRWSLPMACIVLGLFAIPLACAFEGLQRQYGIMLALGMFLVYYSLFSLALSMGEAGALSPATGLWAPNMLFLGLALWGLRQANKEEYLHLTTFFAHLKFWRVLRKKKVQA